MSKTTSTAAAKNSGSTELANPATNNTAIATAAPDFMKGKKTGKENIDQGDMIIPRVFLTQSTHEEVEQGKVAAGKFWHPLLEIDLGDVIDDLVVIHHSKRWTLWKPRHEGGGILARASDGRNWDTQFKGMEFEVQPDKARPRYKVKWAIGDDLRVDRDTGLGRWGTSDPANEDSPPAATLTQVLLCSIPSKPEVGLFVILLQRTAERVAKTLLTKINLDQNAPIYGQVYKVGVKAESGPSGDYKQYTFTKNGYVGSQELFESFEKMHEQFAKDDYKFDDSTDRDAPDGGASGGGDGGAADPNAKY